MKSVVDRFIRKWCLAILMTAIGVIMCLGNNLFAEEIEIVDVEENAVDGISVDSISDVTDHDTEAETLTADDIDAFSDGAEDEVQTEAGFVGENDGIEGSGMCGRNVTWTLDNGVLTISGTGLMYDYTVTTMPWYNMRSEITTVIIENGVTSVGVDAFYDCTNLKNISLTEDVISIGDVAFANSGLTSIVLGKNITKIPNSAFSGCYSLTTVKINGEVTSIDIGAFEDCESLKEINLPSTIKSIGLVAFENCKSLREITLPASLESIGVGAFRGCGLENITIPESVESIETQCFMNCTSLSYAYFMGDSPETIADDAFYRDTFTGCYLADNAWEKSKMKDYGGNITWKAWQPDIAKCTVTLSQSTYAYDGYEKTPSVTVKGGDFTLSKGTDYTLSYENNLNVGTASVIVNGKGKYHGIKNVNFAITSDKLTISVKKNIKKIFKKNQSFSLGASSSGKLTYKSGNKNIASVSSKGIVKMKGIGTTTITIKSVYKNVESAVKVKVTFTPQTVKLQSVKVRGNGTVLITWKREKTASGYEIQYSGSKKFLDTDTASRYAKTNPPKSSIKGEIKKISSGTYYFRVRCYKVVSGKKIYGSWSNIKKVNIS